MCMMGNRLLLRKELACILSNGVQGGDIIIKSDVRWLYRMMLLKIQQHSDQLLRVDDSELFQHHITKYEQAARNSGRYVFAARFVKIR